jgi:hypothetical protein
MATHEPGGKCTEGSYNRLCIIDQSDFHTFNLMLDTNDRHVIASAIL